MNWTPEKVRETADHIFATARSLRETKGHVAPLAFVFRDTPGVAPLAWGPLLTPGATTVEGHIASVRGAVEQIGARFVARVDEAWATYGEDAVAAKVWKEAGNSMEDFPGRQEIIVLSVDGPGLHLHYHCNILDDGKLGPTEVLDIGKLGMQAEGRMVNLSGRLGED